MMQYGNQKIGRIVYVDANGVQHNIKEAYMGGQLVYSAFSQYFIAVSAGSSLEWRLNGKKITTNTIANTPTRITVKEPFDYM